MGIEEKYIPMIINNTYEQDIMMFIVRTLFRKTPTEEPRTM